MMRVLLFGGTGAMGTALVRILAEQGHEVFVTTRKQRKPESSNVHYLVGNAHDMNFVRNVLGNATERHYDVLVDFMVYGSSELSDRAEELLSGVGQYVFLSSSRVYADSELPIREDCPRLLDVCDDVAYLQSDEYALAKAREEDILRNSGHKNWTVIRPYITYSSERLQLGFWEKEVWLQRAIRGGTIVWFNDIASRITTLTSGHDVAKGIAALLGNKKALGEAFHIVSDKSMKWGDVCRLYERVIGEETGRKPRIVCLDSAAEVAHYIGADYQWQYDRMYNRVFDSSKIDKITGQKTVYVPMNRGLELALREFIRGRHEFLHTDWWLEGYLDKLSGESVDLSSIAGIKNKAKYVLARYTFLVKYKKHVQALFRLLKGRR